MLRLKEIRLSKGLSVPKLVELSGVPRHTIQEMERRGEGTVSNARKLADTLDVSLDELYPKEKTGE